MSDSPLSPPLISSPWELESIFDLLPDDTILHIASFLPLTSFLALSLVSKSLHFLLSTHPAAISHLRFIRAHADRLCGVYGRIANQGGYMSSSRNTGDLVVRRKTDFLYEVLFEIDERVFMPPMGSYRHHLRMSGECPIRHVEERIGFDEYSASRDRHWEEKVAQLKKKRIAEREEHQKRQSEEVEEEEEEQPLMSWAGAPAVALHLDEGSSQEEEEEVKLDAEIFCYKQNEFILNPRLGHHLTSLGLEIDKIPRVKPRPPSREEWPDPPLIDLICAAQNVTGELYPCASVESEDNGKIHKEDGVRMFVEFISWEHFQEIFRQRSAETMIWLDRGVFPEKGKDIFHNVVNPGAYGVKLVLEGVKEEALGRGSSILKQHLPWNPSYAEIGRFADVVRLDKLGSILEEVETTKRSNEESTAASRSTPSSSYSCFSWARVPYGPESESFLVRFEPDDLSVGAVALPESEIQEAKKFDNTVVLGHGVNGVGEEGEDDRSNNSMLVLLPTPHASYPDLLLISASTGRIVTRNCIREPIAFSQIFAGPVVGGDHWLGLHVRNGVQFRSISALLDVGTEEADPKDLVLGTFSEGKEKYGYPYPHACVIGGSSGFNLLTVRNLAVTDGDIACFDGNSGTVVRKFMHHQYNNARRICAVPFLSPQAFATLSEGYLKLWDCRDEDSIHTLSHEGLGEGFCRYVLYSCDLGIVTCSTINSHLWDIRNPFRSIAQMKIHPFGAPETLVRVDADGEQTDPLKWRFVSSTFVLTRGRSFATENLDTGCVVSWSFDGKRRAVRRGNSSLFSVSRFL